jgi:hypothetical protein
MVRAGKNGGLPVQASEVIDYGKDLIVANYLRIE